MSQLKNRFGEEIGILIVDDQASVRYLIGEVLQRDIQRILMAENGQQAIALLKEENVDLILLDMKMPGMNGLETLKEIRHRGFNGQVVMMTAYGEGDITDIAKELGVKDFLVKPFDINELQQVVYSCFSVKGRKAHLS